MLNKLKRYYRSEGILATHFTCPHRTDCSKRCRDTFTGPKSAFVSTGYEDGNLPRLLFVSLDSGSAEREPAERHPDAVRRQMEGVDVGCLRRRKPTRHWYRTHELAWNILRQFDTNLEIEEVKYCFAHANSAKCCENLPGGRQAHPRLFRNCRRYLAGEVRALRPVIIVTQGDAAKRGLRPILDVMKPIDEFSCIARFDGRLLFWLHTWHPRRFGDFYKQRGIEHEDGRCEGWQEYAVLIKEFVTSTMRDSG